MKIEQYQKLIKAAEEIECPEGQHICPKTGECVPIGQGKEIESSSFEYRASLIIMKLQRELKAKDEKKFITTLKLASKNFKNL